jgi:delta 1-pyrroline-5-carboxylate dehydrogenase
MESVAEELVQKINEKIAKLKVGMPEDNCDITPVVSQSSANFIQGLAEDAQSKGAKFHQVSIHPCCIPTIRKFGKKRKLHKFVMCSFLDHPGLQM